MNVITSRIARDLGYEKGPHISEKAYLNQLMYGAMSEWLRTITLDVDPAIGSNKIGVRKEYLIERGAEVFCDLSKAIDGEKISHQSAICFTTWMVDQMLDIGELCNPAEHQIVCAPETIVEITGSFARVTGFRKPREFIKHIGLCHWRRTQMTAEAIHAFMQNREALLSELESRYPDLKNVYIKTINPKQFMHCSVDNLAPADKKFVLSHAFPVVETITDVPNATKWFSPTI